MKKLSLILLVFVAGCAADPAKLNRVAVEESVRLESPSKPLSAFRDYELKNFVLSAEVRGDADKVEQAAILERKVEDKLAPLLAGWSYSNDPSRSGTLILQPELVSLRVVSGGARFWIGAFAGESNIDLDLRLIDGTTNEVIAKPRITKNAGAMTGAWSIGQSDQNLHDYIAHIVYQYLASNYQSKGRIITGSVGPNQRNTVLRTSVPSRISEETNQRKAQHFLSKSQLKSLFSGITVRFTSEADNPGTVTFQKNGTMTARIDGPIDVYFDDGRWWLKNPDLFCGKFQRWRSGDTVCTRYGREGNSIKRYMEDGSLATIQPLFPSRDVVERLGAMNTTIVSQPKKNVPFHTSDKFD